MGVRARRDREEWARILGELDRSGEGIEAFCARRGLAASTLRWWRSRLKDAPRVAGTRRRTAGVRLVAVDVVAPVAPAPVPGAAVALRGVVINVAGLEVRVDLGADVRYVADLIAELRSRC